MNKRNFLLVLLAFVLGASVRSWTASVDPASALVPTGSSTDSRTGSRPNGAEVEKAGSAAPRRHLEGPAPDPAAILQSRELAELYGYELGVAGLQAAIDAGERRFLDAVLRGAVAADPVAAEEFVIANLAAFSQGNRSALGRLVRESLFLPRGTPKTGANRQFESLIQRAMLERNPALVLDAVGVDPANRAAAISEIRAVSAIPSSAALMKKLLGQSNLPFSAEELASIHQFVRTTIGRRGVDAFLSEFGAVDDLGGAGSEVRSALAEARLLEDSAASQSDLDAITDPRVKNRTIQRCLLAYGSEIAPEVALGWISSLERAYARPGVPEDLVRYILTGTDLSGRERLLGAVNRSPFFTTDFKQGFVNGED